MARGVNKVILIGNLGADPETRYTGSGTAITSLRLATSESWTDKSSGEKQERTEWHRVKLFGRLAEIAGEYLKKGRQVYIEGSLRTDKYTDKDGVERFSTDIVANEMQMIGGNAGEGGGGGGGGLAVAVAVAPAAAVAPHAVRPAAVVLVAVATTPLAAATTVLPSAAIRPRRTITSTTMIFPSRTSILNS